MRFTRRNEITVVPVWIVGDGAIAVQGVGEGRIIPVVILDTIERTDIVEYIRIHRFSGPGDVLVKWGEMTTREDTVSLTITVQRPVELEVTIAFELAKAHAILVETILKSGALYIQAGTEGDRIGNTLETPRVLLEVPDTGFGRRWEKIYLSYARKKARAEGADRRTAKAVAAERFELLKEMAAARPFPR